MCCFSSLLAALLKYFAELVPGEEVFVYAAYEYGFGGPYYANGSAVSDTYSDYTNELLVQVS
jgi:hypothetical protein